MATVQRWGNSLAVRIPASIAKQLRILEGTAIEISVDDGTLVVRPRRRRYRLKDLLRNCKPAQLHGEI
jgi:antitoxin MazE